MKHMKQRTDCMKQGMFDISVEEFDALEGVHEFSEEYQKKKKELLKEYRKNIYRAEHGSYWKAAAVAAIVIFSTPVIVKAAADSEFISRIWGTAGKDNIDSHEEIIYDEEKDTACTVTYPQREYADTEPERAEELIGDSISYEAVVKELGDTRLTILKAVSDGNAAVVEFTLEKEGGVDALVYSQLDNESKGAWFAEQSPFYFHFADCSENIYVDMNKSTEDLLYCYDYMVMVPQEQMTDKLVLEIEQYSGTGEGDEIQVKSDTLFVPLGGEIKKEEYVNAKGGLISISPLSMKIDVGMGLGLSAEEAYDPWNVYYVAVNYKDKTSYVVHEHEIEGVHSCDVETENSSYACGDLENHLIFVFNRLVDTENVESITINETAYCLR